MKIPEDPDLSVWDFVSLARIRWLSAELTERWYSALGEEGNHAKKWMEALREEERD